MKKALNYPQFLKTVRGYRVPDIEDFVTDAAKSYGFAPQYNFYARRHTGVFIYIYPSKKYAYVDQALADLVGTSVNDIKHNGIGKNERYYYPPDEKIFDEKIFADTLRVFETIPLEDQSNYLMSGNMRAYDKKGELRTFWRESYFIKSAADGMPLVSLGFVTDISHVKNDNQLGYAIRNDKVTLLSKQYYAHGSDQKLSPRQIEIVKLMYDGWNTRQIAEQLFINERTVENHKYNIRNIICADSIAEIIKYALQHGIVS